MLQFEVRRSFNLHFAFRLCNNRDFVRQESVLAVSVIKILCVEEGGYTIVALLVVLLMTFELAFSICS